MTQTLERLGLEYNPFEPVASGAPLETELWIPESWKNEVRRLIDLVSNARGVKGLVLQGEYGSGKTYLLKWLQQTVLRERRVLSYYMHNPGLQFYDLADGLLRQVGRYELAKMVWEQTSPVVHGFQFSYEGGLPGWLRSIARQKRQDDAIMAIANAIQEQEITDDEEIAHRLGRMVVETATRPYFEYRDFVAGRPSSLVAEREEAPYFTALVRILQKATQAEGVAFLIDEFEEIALHKRLTQRQAYDYLATLKRLMNVAHNENFWLVLAMTPSAAEKTWEIESGLHDRFITGGGNEFTIPQLVPEEATDLVRRRLTHARLSDREQAADYPFPEGFAALLRQTTISLPRRLVKVCFQCIAEAERDPQIAVPFEAGHLQAVEERLYPAPAPTEAEVEEPV